MNLKVIPMNHSVALKILSWRYKPPYDLYNIVPNDEEVNEKLNGSYQAIFDKDKQIILGFFCTGLSAQVPAGKAAGVYKEQYIDIGLGMSPEYTGKGCGTEFLSFIIKELKQRHPDSLLRLTVSVFNKRAIRLYEKMGFYKKDDFSSLTVRFITMIQKS